MWCYVQVGFSSSFEPTRQQPRTNLGNFFKNRKENNSPRYFPPEPPEFGGVDACCCCCCDDIPCDDPKAGAESGRVPALIGVETALAVADCPTLLFPLMPPAAVSSPDTSIVRLFFILLVGMWFFFAHSHRHTQSRSYTNLFLPLPD